MPGDKSDACKRVADDLSTRLSAVEGEIYQVKNQSSQDPLNYPIKLNNKIAALAGVVGGTDAKPTSQSHVVFVDLASQLDRQLLALRANLASGLPPLNAALKAAGLPEIVPSTQELKTPAARAQPAVVDEEDDKKR